MKNIKIKTVLLACSLMLAVLLGGCGKTPAAEESPKGNSEAEQTSAEIESETEEPSLMEQALAAYQEILKAAPAVEGEHAEFSDASFGYDQNQEKFGNHFELFALYDLNQDEIPELIAMSTVNFRWTPVYVYTYADGEAVLLKDPRDMDAHGTFEQMSTASGAYTTYICKENHIHSVWHGMTLLGEAEDNFAYTLEETLLLTAECTAGAGDDAVNFNDIAKANTAENVDAMLK